MVGLLLILALAQNNLPPPDFTPTKLYKRSFYEGFELIIHPDLYLKSNKSVFDKGMIELRRQLSFINTSIPRNVLLKFKKTIWIEIKNGVWAAAYHPSRAWLEQHKYNGDKEKSVEIVNFKTFLDWSKQDQPCMMLHEMAHAYHHLALGYENQVINGAYQSAINSGKYDLVYHVNGQRMRHYALTNEKEYFAECSEAYFGKNDLFPFTREDFRKFDPVGFRMIQKLYMVGDNVKIPPGGPIKILPGNGGTIQLRNLGNNLPSNPE